MAIRWIINGYFRSGTTFLWDRFRKAVNDDVLCLYEPLHPDLPNFLEKGGRDDSGKRLHHLDMWSDYLHIHPDHRQLLLDRHPNRSANCDWSGQELAAYLEILHTLDEDVMIQTNRLHYDFTQVADMTGAPIVHILRNPVEVFHSIRHTYFSNVGKARGFIRRLAYPLRGSRVFETDAWMNRAMKAFPRLYSVMKRDPQRLLSCFVPAWIGANYAAVQSLSSHQGIICAYKELFLHPVALAEKLKLCLNVPFSIVGEATPRHCAEIRDRDGSRFNDWVERWGLENEWRVIRGVMEEREGR